MSVNGSEQYTVCNSIFYQGYLCSYECSQYSMLEDILAYPDCSFCIFKSKIWEWVGIDYTAGSWIFLIGLWVSGDREIFLLL